MSKLNSLYTEGISHIQKNEFQQAIPLLLTVTQSLPDYVPSRMNLANCYSEIGNFKEALKHFKYLINLIKNGAKYKQYEFQIYGNIAQLYMDLKKTDKSIYYFQHALNINGEWYEGHYNLANLYHEQGEPENEAKTLHHYVKAIEIEPNEPDAHSNYSLCLFQSGKLFEAKKQAETALKLAPNNSIYNFNLASICQYSGDLDESMNYIKKAIELDPFHHESIFSLAILYELSDQPNFAVQYYEKAIEVVNSLLQDKNLSSKDLFWVFADYSFRYFSLLQRLNHQKEGKQIIIQLITIGSSLLTEIEKSLLYFLSGDHSLALKKLSSNSSDINLPISTLCLKSISSIHLRNSSEIIHKCKLAKNIQNSNFLWVIPTTFVIHSYNELIEAVTNYETHNNVNVWYLKDPHKQRAQGITIFSNTETDLKKIKDQDVLRVEKEYCLQPSVENVYLLDNRKFGLRIHTFVISFRNKLYIYLFKDAILTKCGIIYSPNDKSELNQITCTSVQRSLPGYDRSTVKGPASIMYPRYDVVFERIMESVTLSITAVKNKIDSLMGVKVEDLSDNENNLRFQMFGYDYIVNDNETPILLEVNSSPQLGDAQNMPQLTHTIGMPLINSIPSLLSNCVSGTAIDDKFWVKLAELDS